jgi:hypothetical protein
VSPKRAIFPVSVLIVLGCLLVAFVDLGLNASMVWSGLIYGSMFGQTTLAGAWCALGPGRLIWRVPLSLVWVAALVFAFVFNLGMLVRIVFSDFVFVLAGGLLAQWLIVAVTLWALAIVYGWRIQFQPGETFLAQPHGRRQFGIRQLMILTASVGVLLGTGRMVISSFPAILEVSPRDVQIVVFLAIAAILITLPLLVSTLMPKWVVVSCVALLGVIGLATIWEFPLLKFVDPNMPDEVAYLLFSTNYVTAAWILAFALTMWLCGYGTTRPANDKVPISA